jgi:predicted dehydrogenase
MSKTWRCAIVGTGVVGEWHTRLVPQVKGAVITAACDKVIDKVHAAVAKNKLENVAVYADEAEMLAKSPDIDVVHICTPSGDHMDPAIMAMEAGKNVIVEKPMEIQLDRIDRMIAAAKANNVRLAGIFQNRWKRANRAIKAAADAGRFGTIAWAGSFTPWFRTDEYYRDGGWRGTWRMDGGGAIMNQSVHAVDLLQWVVGPIKSVSAYASSRIHPEIEVEDTLSCSLEFENGAYGTIMGSTAMWPGTAVRLEVGGATGHAVSEGSLQDFRFRDELPEDAATRERLGPNAGKAATTGGGASATDVPMELHVLNMMHIFDAWNNNQDAETHGPEARKAVAIIMAMYESAKTGKRVEVQK